MHSSCRSTCYTYHLHMVGTLFGRTNFVVSHHMLCHTTRHTTTTQQQQLFVVKLHRKPLFPGIYTPVTITNNARLIKDISEKKRSG